MNNRNYHIVFESMENGAGEKEVVWTEILSARKRLTNDDWY